MTTAPGCAAMKLPHPKTASSRCGDTITTRSSSPGSGKPQPRIGTSSSTPSSGRRCSATVVQPRVDAFGLLVDRAEFLVELVVHGAVPAVGLERLHNVDARRDVVDRRAFE